MRTYMRRRSGYRSIRGGHVIELQKEIAKDDVGPISVDGVFGGQTEAALKYWQAKKSLPTTGMVDEQTWIRATNKELPSQFQRCLAITAAFEGHGYTLAAGNWDNAYLTWGIIGFTLKHGNLGKVIKMIVDRHPSLLRKTIGKDKADELWSIIFDTAANKKAWGNSISVEPKKYRVRSDWKDAFEALGNQPEVRLIQEEVARKVYWSKAVADLKKYGKLTESDISLFFDTAVQNGGVDSKKAQLIKKAINDNPDVNGKDRLVLLATAIADGSNPKYREDVLSRRNAIATGVGLVHGAKYYLEDWAIGLHKITTDQLDP